MKRVLGGSSFSKWVVLITVIAALASLAVALTLTQRPRTVQDPNRQGVKVVLAPGDSLQDALDDAEPGDTIIVQAGAVFRGPFKLRKKQGASYITIQSSRSSEMPDGVRVSNSRPDLFAKLQTTNSTPVVDTEAGAHHYRFVGIEFSTTTPDITVYDLVRLGGSKGTQTTLDSVPHHLIIDRCYIHGFASQDVQRGISLNSSDTDITNSYISDIHGVGYDTQAIAGWNGPGPFHIVNNYLEAAGENILFGGSDPGIRNLVPSDIEIRGNFAFKPLSWKVGAPNYAGKHWTVKNLLELKNARNVVIDGNVFENCWTDGQTGIPILFTVRNQDGTAPWSIVQNVTFTNNLVKGAEGAINMLGSDNERASQRSTGAVISNNVFIDLTGPFLTMNGFYNVTFDHNTHFQSGNIMTLYGTPSLGFVYRNNLTIRADSGYGVFGEVVGEGTVALTKFTPGYEFQKNLIIKGDARLYPAQNFFPESASSVSFQDYAARDYRLGPSSRFRKAASDNAAIGGDISSILKTLKLDKLP